VLVVILGMTVQKNHLTNIRMKVAGKTIALHKGDVIKHASDNNADTTLFEATYMGVEEACVETWLTKGRRADTMRKNLVIIPCTNFGLHAMQLTLPSPALILDCMPCNPHSLIFDWYVVQEPLWKNLSVGFDVNSLDFTLAKDYPFSYERCLKLLGSIRCDTRDAEFGYDPATWLCIWNDLPPQWTPGTFVCKTLKDGSNFACLKQVIKLCMPQATYTQLDQKMELVRANADTQCNKVRFSAARLGCGECRCVSSVRPK